jgi:hypothetical protein
MFESTIAAGLRRPTHHLRWFLVGGGIGFLTAIFCATNLGQHVLPEKLWMSLWPMGIALMAVDNASWGTLIFALLLTYGGNFVLYGIVALLISLATDFIQSFLPHSPPKDIQP